MRNADHLLVGDRRESVALSSGECLRMTKGIVVGMVFDTGPIKRVGGSFEDASVRRSVSEDISVNTSWR